MKNKKGITLIALIVTIMVMSIIIGISVSTGSNILQKSKATDYIGYMKLVKARADVVFEDELFNGIDLSLDEISDEISDTNIDTIISNKGYNGYIKKIWYGNDIAAQGIDKSILNPGIDRTYNTEDTNEEYFVIVFDKDTLETIDVIYSSGCSIDSVRYYSMNEMEAAVDGKIYVTNLIKNGDFSDGFAGWTKNNAAGTGHEISTAYALFGTKSFKKPITSTVPYNYITQVPSSGWIANHKYYVSLYAYNPSETSSSVNFDIGNAGYGTSANINVNSGWTKLSLIYPSDGVSRNIAVNYVATNAVTYVDGVCIIDLTATFGEGKEPDKAWCDANLGYGVTEVEAPTN